MRRSLALVALAVTAMVALAFLIPLAVAVKEIAEDRAIADAERQATAMVPALVVTDDAESLRRALASTPAGAERLAVHLRDGATVGVSRATPAEVAGAGGRVSTVRVAGGYALLKPVALGGGRQAVIEAYAPDKDVTKGVAASWAVLTGVALALVAGSVAVGDRLGARVVRSARRLGDAAAALGSGDLSVRVTPDGPPELMALGKAFNTMADQVTGLLAAERELAADLSHRLRTPLTALRLNVGGGPEAEQSRLAIDRLEQAVDEIIEAARRPVRPVAKSCDAAEVLRERLAFWSALADDQERPWELAGADAPSPVPVAAADLGAAVDALLGNVFRHTPQGTGFRVALHQGAGMTGILVSDAGPGFADPEGALRRGHSGAGSTGLGLDIARRLAESTGGSLRIDPPALGGAGVHLWIRADGSAVRSRPRRLLRRGRAH
ncbi:two-component sensor histidine kinase [Planotetraspora thailandica]|uniref:Signal transduction histidine-protein kinase/phosphatase MprB n=1 Tax=Planotetraspora thailandica TaxID=487172 RepID=A0A8J3XXB5_9ACTN|nr:HAMP domain-containing protein [Planotetraspora thailandica]GII56434.1 two-component sensor histidine kinase [Planotetraspora thailandica]